MLFRTIYTLLLILCLFQVVTAQEPEGPSLVFGEVSIAELKKPESLIEESASAEILGDYGYINERGKYTRFVRTKIFDQNGYEYANITIPQYKNAKILNIKGFTHNLVDGKVEKIPLAEDQIIEEKVINKQKVIKITFPQVKPGSVLDLEVTKRFRPGYAIQQWVFQREIPVVWSELAMKNYQLQNVVFFSQGLEPYTISTHEMDSKKRSYALYNKMHHRWVRANLKPLENEPFISSLNNYIAKIDFEYNGGRTYLMFSLGLLRSGFFNPIENSSEFLDTIIARVDTSKTELEKAKELFHMIRDTMKWNGYYGFLPDPLKEAWKKKSGDVPSINFMLAEAMRKAGLDTAPIVISTKENGLLHPEYAVANQLNYLICGVYIDDKWILLDASDPAHQFGILPYRCLNDKGWSLSPTKMGWVELTPQGYAVSTSQANLTLDENGHLSGTLSNKFTNYIGFGERELIEEIGEEKFAETENEEIPEWLLSNFQVENLKDYSLPLLTSYDLQNSENEGNELIYLEPIIYGKHKRQPFESETRTMPVNFPFRTMDRYFSMITLPKNYVVDELPKSQTFQMPDKDIFFQFSVTAESNRINIVSNFRMKGIDYPVEEYAAIKTFFETVVNKQSEQIVLRRVE